MDKNMLMYQQDLFDSRKDYCNYSILMQRIERAKRKKEIRVLREIKQVLLENEQFFTGSAKYNGLIKSRTKDCNGCRWLEVVKSQELCLWGKCWKRLVSAENPRKCQYREIPSPRES